MSTVRDLPSEQRLKNQRVAFVGRLSGMSKRDAGRIVRDHGGVPAEQPDAAVDLLVIGDNQSADRLLDVVARCCEADVVRAAQRSAIRLESESEFWQRLGFLEAQEDVQRLYTPAMLAEILGVPVAVIRRWHRRGLLESAREVRRLPYFDFGEVRVARLLAELLQGGCSLAAIERTLAELERQLPGVPRPLKSMPFVVEGRRLLLRQGEELSELSGQLRIDFAAIETPREEPSSDAPDNVEAAFSAAESSTAADAGTVPIDRSHQVQALDAPRTVCSTPDEMINLATELETDGHLDEAIEMYRAALVAAGPKAEVNFLLAEALYRQGELVAARERYYCAIELDEDYVEARANLGCVLAETGERELAVAAFQGALRFHQQYPDVHFHLARTLDELNRRDEAALHWQAFLAYTPDSPWADEARDRLRENSAPTHLP